MHSFADELGSTALCPFIDVVIGGAGVMLLLHSSTVDSFGIYGDGGVIDGYALWAGKQNFILNLVLGVGGN